MLPDLIPVRQRFGAARVDDLPGAVRRALEALHLELRIHPGMTVGIPAGSRGIRHIPLILREAVRYVRSLGAQPLVVAAMGSHGGGTADGQRAVLSGLGITEESVEAPIRTDVEAEVVGRAADGTPVYFDRNLLQTDGLLVINRVKPHTSFRGSVESGLVKMLVVGCGKPSGAKLFHSLGAAELGPRLREFGAISLSRLPILGGVAILENQAEETADVVPLQPEGFLEAEARLLERAWQLLPGLPVSALDLLVVDRIGKEYSGTCMDTNVIGRVRIPGIPEAGPDIRRIVALDLSDASHGNANGVGLADLVTRRLVSKIDFPATYLNCLTATFVERAKIPITLDSDRAVIEAALQTVGSPHAPRIARIKSTLELEDLLLSPAALAQLRPEASLEVVGAAQPWPFDSTGNLF